MTSSLVLIPKPTINGHELFALTRFKYLISSFFELKSFPVIPRMLTAYIKSFDKLEISSILLFDVLGATSKIGEIPNCLALLQNSFPSSYGRSGKMIPSISFTTQSAKNLSIPLFKIGL